ncbi:MAG: AI-2E family transporter [Myxococcales bacterium]|nr:AI-2E family transporter [Myxococcales bacterium]
MGPGAKALLVLASVVVVLAGIKAATPILTPVLLAGFITMASTPLLLWLRARRVPDSLSIVLVMMVTLSVVTLLGLLVATSVNALVVRVPQYEQQLRSSMTELGQWLGGHGLALSPQTLSEMIDPGPVLSVLGQVLQGLASFASVAALVLLVVVFMLLESLGLRRKLERIALEPSQILELEGVSRMVYRYLGVKTLTSGATGLLVGLWTAYVGLDLPVLWGVLAFLLNYVPTIGSIIAAVPAVVVALLQLGVGPALAVVVGYLLINFVIGNGVEPRIMGAALGLSPLVVFFSLLLWGWLLGPIGALLSVPLTILARIFLASMPDLAWLSILLGPAEHDDIAATSLPPPPPTPSQRVPPTPAAIVDGAPSEP